MTVMAYAVGPGGISIAADRRAFGPGDSARDGATKVIAIGDTIVGLAGVVTALDRPGDFAETGACHWGQSTHGCDGPRSQLVLPSIARCLEDAENIPRAIVNEMLEQHVAELCFDDRFLAVQWSRHAARRCSHLTADHRWLDVPKTLGLTYGWSAEGVGWLKQRIYRSHGCDVRARDAWLRSTADPPKLWVTAPTHAAAERMAAWVETVPLAQLVDDPASAALSAVEASFRLLADEPLAPGGGTAVVSLEANGRHRCGPPESGL